MFRAASATLFLDLFRLPQRSCSSANTLSFATKNGLANLIVGVGAMVYRVTKKPKAVWKTLGALQNSINSIC
jgi:hypothetical protein